MTAPDVDLAAAAITLQRLLDHADGMAHNVTIGVGGDSTASLFVTLRQIAHGLPAFHGRAQIVVNTPAIAGDTVQFVRDGQARATFVLGGNELDGVTSECFAWWIDGDHHRVVTGLEHIALEYDGRAARRPHDGDDRGPA